MKTTMFAGLGALLLSVASAADLPKYAQEAENKIRGDIEAMLKNYDFESVFQQAVEEERIRAEEEAASSQKSVEVLMTQLLEAMKTQETKTELFPDAPLKDSEMFDHLNFDFDTHSGVVTVETLAKDSHGKPHYQYTYDSAAHTGTTYENSHYEVVDAAPAKTESATTTVAAADIAVKTIVAKDVVEKEQTPVKEETTTQTVYTDQYGNRVLSIEEQREVAFKVCFFFISVIVASFAGLYIYHRMSQSKVSAEKDKQTFFDFLAGQIDDNYPMQAAAMTGSRYRC